MPSLAPKSWELQATSSNSHPEELNLLSSGNTVTKLIYNPKSITITVLPHHGQFSNWTKKWKTKKTDSLEINLHRIERMTSSRWQERVLLHVHLHHVPRQMFSHLCKLREAGIYPNRYYKNLPITSLVLATIENSLKLSNEPLPICNTSLRRNSSSSPFWTCQLYPTWLAFSWTQAQIPMTLMEYD